MRKSSIAGAQSLRVNADDKRSSAAGRLSSGLPKPPVRRSGIPVTKKPGSVAALPTGASVVPRKRQSSSLGSAYLGSNRMSNAEMSKKDSRPIHERSYQQKCAASLIKFLESQHYPHPVNLKTVMTPQTKDFLRIFEFLFKFLDPAYTIPARMEEDIPRAMKSIFYPYAITKSQLLNIGARHSWPALLAALDWLRCLIETTIDYDCEANIDAFESTELSEDKGFVDFSVKAYKEFMAGNDVWPELEKEFEDHLVGDTVRVTNALAEPCNQLLTELESLRSIEGKGEQAKMALHNLNGDITKCTTYKRDIETLMDRKLKENTSLEAQHTVLQEELNAYIEDNHQKKAICLSQPMNLQEAEELRQDSIAVEHQCSSVDDFIMQIKKQIWNEEKNISSLKEKVSTEENCYNSKAQANQFIPSTAQNAQGHNFEVNTAFNLNSKDFSTVEFLQIQAIKQFKEGNRTKQLDLIKEEECHERLGEQIKETNEELAESNQSIRNVEKELNYRKEEGYNEINKLQEEIKRIEGGFRDKRPTRDFNKEQAEQVLSDLKQQLAETTEARKQQTARLFQDLEDTATVVLEYKQSYDEKIVRRLEKRFGKRLVDKT